MPKIRKSDKERERGRRDRVLERVRIPVLVNLLRFILIHSSGRTRVCRSPRDDASAHTPPRTRDQRVPLLLRSVRKWRSARRGLGPRRRDSVVAPNLRYLCPPSSLITIICARLAALPSFQADAFRPRTGCAERAIERP